MLELYGVSIKMNKTTTTVMKIIWHLSILPITSSPLQFMITYAKITPMIPKSEVEAPTLMSESEGLVKSEKILPPIPDTK